MEINFVKCLFNLYENYVIFLLWSTIMVNCTNRFTVTGPFLHSLINSLCHCVLFQICCWVLFAKLYLEIWITLYKQDCFVVFCVLSFLDYTIFIIILVFFCAFFFSSLVKWLNEVEDLVELPVKSFGPWVFWGESSSLAVISTSMII